MRRESRTVCDSSGLQLLCILLSAVRVAMPNTTRRTRSKVARLRCMAASRVSATILVRSKSLANQKQSLIIPRGGRSLEQKTRHFCSGACVSRTCGAAGTVVCILYLTNRNHLRPPSKIRQLRLDYKKSAVGGWCDGVSWREPHRDWNFERMCLGTLSATK